MRWLATTLALLLFGSTSALAQEAAPTADPGVEAAAEAPPADGEAAAPEPAAEAAPAPDPAEGGAEVTEIEATAAETPEAVDPAPEEAPAAPVDPDHDGVPEIDQIDMERIIVASVAGVVALGGLGVGIAFGVMAQQEYDCLNDVISCNADRDDPIEGTDFLDARGEVERKALYADMGYLVAVTAATVAIVGAIELLFGQAADAAAEAVE